jgi:hypothetical protein
VNPALVLIPVYTAAVAFEAFCLVDLARAEEVRRLPRGAWAIICLVSIPLGGIIYLAAGRVRTAHEYQRGYRTALSTVSTAGEVAWPALADLASQEFDLRAWARSRKAELGKAAAGQPPGISTGFHLPAWFAPLASDLGSLLDPIGFERWSFTPTGPFVRGYQAGLREAWEAGARPKARA